MFLIWDTRKAESAFDLSEFPFAFYKTSFHSTRSIHSSASRTYAINDVQANKGDDEPAPRRPITPVLTYN
jgi:hypothetical protein